MADSSTGLGNGAAAVRDSGNANHNSVDSTKPAAASTDTTPSPAPSSSSPSPSAAASASPASSSSSSEETSSDGRNLYVDNLALTSDVELRNLFLPYGPILKSRLAIDPITRQPAGYGFVMFERREDARKAIDGLNQHVLGTKRLRVSVKRTKPAATQQQQQPQSQLQQREPPAKASAADGAGALFASSSSVTPVRPVVTASPSSASSVSQSATISSSSPAHSSASSTNLYISGLPVAWRQSDVESLFCTFGRISDSRLLIDRITGQPRGVAMLRFESPDSAAEAIAALHRAYTPAGSQQAITVKYATDKPAPSTPQQLQLAQRISPATPLLSTSSSAQSNVLSLTPASLSSSAFSSSPHRSPKAPTASSSSASAQSPSSPHLSRLSAGLTATLRGSPLIRLLHPSDITPPPPHDGESSGGQNGVSPVRSASSLSSKSTSPPPHVTALDSFTAHSFTSPSATRLAQHSNGPLSHSTPAAAVSAAYNTPVRLASSSSAGKQQQTHSRPSHSPQSAPRQMNGVYAAVQQQQQQTRLVSPLPLSVTPPPFVHPTMQQPNFAVYSTHPATASPAAALHSHPMTQQTASSGSGQTPHRYSSVGLAA